MQMTVMSAGPSEPHAGWAAIDELAELLTQHFHADWLSPAPARDYWWRRAIGRARPRHATVQASGGDVLFVVARGPADLALVNAVPDARRRYSQIHAFVTDSYFEAGYPAATALYDSITVTAHEDMAFPASRFGIRVHQLYQGVDGLRWSAPAQRPAARDIDLMAYGRTPPSHHQRLCHRLHHARSPYLYLHSPIGNLRGPSVQRERAMLFKLLHRTHVSLAFHLLVEPELARPRSMMVTSRWLESLVAGCIVAGQRPISRMADEMLHWKGCTVELPADPDAAVDAIETLLADRSSLESQRRINIRQTLASHDWRWRLRDLCHLHGWQEPASLKQELQQVLDVVCQHDV